MSWKDKNKIIKGLKVTFLHLSEGSVAYVCVPP